VLLPLEFAPSPWANTDDERYTHKWCMPQFPLKARNIVAIKRSLYF
jgi:hypothetical protein